MDYNNKVWEPKEPSKDEEAMDESTTGENTVKSSNEPNNQLRN